MRIAKASLVDPQRNDRFAIIAIAVSLFVFAYSTSFGKIPILAYYALWFPLVLVDYRRVLGRAAPWFWVSAFGILALSSTVWSDAPGVTERAGLQYVTHIACAMIAARTIGARSLSKGCLLGAAFVLAYSLAFGRYELDALDGTYSFSGAFASKNQLGLFASLGVYFAFSLLVLLSEKGIWLPVALGVAGMSGYCLAASQSATSIIVTVAVLAISTGMRFAGWFAAPVRKLLFIVGVALALVMALLALNLGGFDALLAAFGKSATLTGRTYLWSQGLAAAQHHPVLGVGYQGYWVEGFSEAERLWKAFGITAKTGFHFHNTYIETLVELGIVGLVFIATLMIATLTGHLIRLLKDSRNPVSHMMFDIMLMLFVRSFLEVDIINTYVVGSFFFYFAAGKLFAAREPLPCVSSVCVFPVPPHLIPNDRPAIIARAQTE